MRLKDLLLTVVITGAALWVIIPQNSTDRGVSNLVMSSVEVLSKNENMQEYSQKGPRSMIKCEKGGTSLICLNLIDVECTETPCRH